MTAPDPAPPSDEAVARAALRSCVHCGFCTATCPTYVLLGDELDSPRGRIELMKGLLRERRPPSPKVVRHIDRCLSCLSCTSTCPSGVDYMHLVDQARAVIEETYRRPLADRLLRSVLALVLPDRGRFRLALRLGRIALPLAPVIARIPALRSVSAMLALLPRRARRPAPASPPALGTEPPVGRVAVLEGCAEPVLRPHYRSAALRVLARAGYEVVPVPGEACCGALVAHMGRHTAALTAARRNVDAWARVIERDRLDAILVTASGCGTTVKDYGFLLRSDPRYASRAARISAMAFDTTEFLAALTPDARADPRPARLPVVAYHAACSLQHGQQVKDAPRQLLAAAGYEVRTPADAHLCCGSAGTYNILQPELAGELGRRKAETLDRTGAEVIATTNVGCALQIGTRTGLPVVHVVELLDWAAGGPAPDGLEGWDAQ